MTQLSGPAPAATQCGAGARAGIPDAGLVLAQAFEGVMT